MHIYAVPVSVPVAGPVDIKFTAPYKCLYQLCICSICSVLAVNIVKRRRSKQEVEQLRCWMANFKDRTAMQFACSCLTSLTGDNRLDCV